MLAASSWPVEQLTYWHEAGGFLFRVSYHVSSNAYAYPVIIIQVDSSLSMVKTPAQQTGGGLEETYYKAGMKSACKTASRLMEYLKYKESNSWDQAT